MKEAGIYEIKQANYMLDDLKKYVFERVAKSFSEKQLGSERSHALLTALRKRLPKIYRSMMSQYRQESKKEDKKKEADDRKMIEREKKETTALRRKLQSL